MTWLTTSSLTNKNIRLEPLSLEHISDLSVAVQDGNLWELWFTSVPNQDSVESYIKEALQKQDELNQLAFAVIDSNNDKAVGSTRFCNIDSKNKRLEIGYTWYAKSYQRTATNTICKLLLLQHAFETLDCIAVEFRTHIKNTASRKAIARLGAKQDGILRQHQQLKDGSYRDTVVFSILNSEWPSVKKKLSLKLNSYS